MQQTKCWTKFRFISTLRYLIEIVIEFNIPYQTRQCPQQQKTWSAAILNKWVINRKYIITFNYEQVVLFNLIYQGKMAKKESNKK